MRNFQPYHGENKLMFNEMGTGQKPLTKSPPITQILQYDNMPESSHVLIGRRRRIMK
jgi:hypothetical protein